MSKEIIRYCFFKQETAYEFLSGLVGSEMCIRDRSMIGTLAWAAVVASVGYFFGYALESMLGNVKQYELLIFGVFAGIGIIIWLIRHLRHR